MKTLLIASMLLSTAAFAEPGPIETPSPVHKVFAPHGFDDNDVTEIVVHGEFPDTCYQTGRSWAEVDHAKKVISVVAMSYRYMGGMECAQVKTPFIQTVKVGVLKEGDYSVVVKYADGLNANLNIRPRTTEAPEDFLYAPVENAKIKTDAATGKQSLSLNGHFPYMFIGCMKMREIRTSRNGDVLVVQPVAEIMQNDEECPEQPDDKSFEINQGIAEPFTTEGLIHVRVLNGNSLNRFVPAP